jgi:hypothetical protein
MTGRRRGRKKDGSIKNKRNEHGWKRKDETGEAKPTVFECPVRRRETHTKVES